MNRTSGQIVDSKVVELSFDNENFEQNAKQSLKTLDELKNSLKFDGAVKGFDNIDKAAKKVSFDSIASGIEAIEKRFSTFGIVGATVIMDLTRKAEAMVSKVLSSVTALPNKAWNLITEGGKNRAFGIENSRFMLQGLFPDELEEVQKIMDDAMDSVDGTAYAFDSAAQAASQFAASGLRAGEQMSKALKGITGVAAMTNSQYEDISRIFTTVAGNGRLMGDQLLQLSGRGLNAASTLATFFKDVATGSEKVVNVSDDVKKKVKELGASVNTTEADIRAFVSDGKISFDIFSEAMTNAFGEHAKKANITFTGSLANMQAALKKIGAKFFTPLIEQEGPLVHLFNAVRIKINEVNKAIDPLINFLSGSAIKGIETLTNAVEKFDFQKTGFKQFLDAFGKTEMVSKDQWKKLEESGLASPKLVENLRKSTEASGHARNSMIDDQEWLNDALNRGIITVKNLNEAMNDFAVSAKGGADVNADLKKTFDSYADDPKMQELVKNFDEISKKYSQEDLMSIVFGDNKYSDVAGDVEATVDSMLSLMDLTQENGDDILKMLLSVEDYGETTTKAITDLTNEQLKQQGYTDEQIEKIRELRADGKSTQEILSTLGIDTRSGLDLMLDSVSNVITSIGQVFGSIKEAFNDTFSTKTAGGFHDIFKGINDFSKSLVLSDERTGQLKEAMGGLLSVLKIIGNTIGAVVGPALSAVASVFRTIGGVLLDILSPIGTAITKFSEFLEEIGFFKTISSGLTSVLGTVTGKFSDFGKTISEKATTAFTKLKGAIEDNGGFKAIGQEIGNFVSGAKDKIKEFIGNVKEMGGIKLTNIGAIFGNFRDTVIGYFKNFDGFDALKGTFMKLWDDISNSETVKKIGETFGGAFDSVKEKLKGFGIDISWITDGFKNIGSFGVSSLKKLKTLGGSVTKVFTNLGKSFIGSFSKNFGELTKKAQPFLEGGKVKIDEFIKKVKSLGGINLSTIGDVFKALKTTIIDYFANFDGFDAIKDAFAKIWTDFRANASKMNINLDWLFDGFEGVGRVASGAFNIIVSGAHKAIEFISKLWSTITNSRVVQNAIERFGNAFNYIKENAGNIFSSIGESFTKFMNNAKTLGGFDFKNVGDYLVLFKENVVDGILGSEWVTKIKEAVGGVVTDVKTAIREKLIDFGIPVEDIENTFKNLPANIQAALDSVTLPDWLEKLVNDLLSIFNPKEEGSGDTKLDVINKRLEEMDDSTGPAFSLSSILDTIISKLDNIRQKLVDFGRDAKNTVKEFASSIGEALGSIEWPSSLDEIPKFIDSIVNAVKDFKVPDSLSKIFGETAEAAENSEEVIKKTKGKEGEKEHITIFDTVKGIIDKLVEMIGWAKQHLPSLLAGIIVFKTVKKIFDFISSITGFLEEKQKEIKAENFSKRAWGITGIGIGISLIIEAVNKMQNMLLDDAEGLNEAALNKAVGIFGRILAMIAGLVVLLSIHGEYKGVLGPGTGEIGYDVSAAAIWGIAGIIAAIGLALAGILAEEWLFDNDGSKLERVTKSITSILKWIAGLGIVIGLFGPGLIHAVATGIPEIVAALTAVAPQLGMLFGAISLVALAWAALDAGGALLSGGTTTLTSSINAGLEGIFSVLETLAEGLGKIAGLVLGGIFEGIGEGVFGDQSPMEILTKDIQYLIDTFGDGTFVANIKQLSELQITDEMSDNLKALTLAEVVMSAAGFVAGLSSIPTVVQFDGDSAVALVVKDIAFLAETFGDGEFMKDIAMIGALPIDDKVSDNLKALNMAELVTGLNGFAMSIMSLIPALLFGKSAVTLVVDDVAYIAEKWGSDDFKGSFENLAEVPVPQETLDKLSSFNDIGFVMSLTGFLTGLGDFVNNTLLKDGKSNAKRFVDDLVYIANKLGGERFKLQMERLSTVDVPSDKIDTLKESISHINGSGIFGAFEEFVNGSKLENLKAFTEHATELGKAVKGFADGLSGVNLFKLATAASAAESLATITQFIEDISFTDSYSLEFSGALTTIGQALSDFVTNVGDVTAASELASSTADLIEGIHTLEDVKLSGAISDTDLVTTFKDNLETIKKAIESLAAMDTSGVATLGTAMDDLSKQDVPSMDNAAKKATEATSGQMKDAASGQLNEAASAVSSNTSLETAMGDKATAAVDAIKNVRGFITAGYEMVDQLKRGAESNSSLSTAIGAIVAAAAAEAGNYYGSFYSSGSYVAMGFSSGMYHEMLGVIAAARALAEAAVNAIKDRIKQGSPSKVTMESGRFFGEGFVIGILSQADRVEASAASIGNRARRGLDDAVAAINTALSSDFDAQPVIRPVLDLSEIQNGAGNISSLLTAMNPIDPFGSFSAIGSAVEARRRQASLEDVVSALGSVERSTSNIRGGDTYNVNGVTYDDGSNITEAIRTLTHAVITDRRR